MESVSLELLEKIEAENALPEQAQEEQVTTEQPETELDEYPLPDASLNENDLNEHGYEDRDMLPLSAEKATMSEETSPFAVDSLDIVVNHLVNNDLTESFFRPVNIIG